MNKVDIQKRLHDYINDADLLELLRIENIIQDDPQKSTDFFDELPPVVQQLILKSKDEIKDGKVHSTESVLQEARAKYGVTKKK